jgi:hypothetical protein
MVRRQDGRQRRTKLRESKATRGTALRTRGAERRPSRRDRVVRRRPREAGQHRPSERAPGGGGIEDPQTSKLRADHNRDQAVRGATQTLGCRLHGDVVGRRPVLGVRGDDCTGVDGGCRQHRRLERAALRGVGPSELPVLHGSSYRQRSRDPKSEHQWGGRAACRRRRHEHSPSQVVPMSSWNRTIHTFPSRSIFIPAMQPRFSI